MPLIILIFGLITISPALFQEGNPIPVFKGMMKLSLNQDKIVQISDSPKKYISKTNIGENLLIKLLEKESWKFDEQLGAGYLFSKDENKLVVTSVQYTRKYKVWKFGDLN